MRKNNIKSYFIAGSFFMATFLLVGCGTQDEEENKFTYEDAGSVNEDVVTEDEKKQEKNVDAAEKKEGMGERPDGAHGGGMSEEALAACEDKSEDDACTITMTNPEGEESEVSGTCKVSREDDVTFACMPEDMPEGGPGGPGRPGEEIAPQE